MKNHSACPIGKVAGLLSDPWTMMILHYVNEEPKRFCELEKALNGISTRTLTLKLKKLAEENMLEKSEDGVYLPTKQGKGVKMIEKAMVRYQKEYL